MIKKLVTLLLLTIMTFASDFYVHKGLMYDYKDKTPYLTYGLTARHYFLSASYNGDNTIASAYTFLNTDKLKLGVGLNYDKDLGTNASAIISVYVTSYMDFVVEATPDNGYFKILIYK